MTVHSVVSLAYYGIVLWLTVMVAWTIIQAPRLSDKLAAVVVYIPLLLRVLRIK